MAEEIKIIITADTGDAQKAAGDLGKTLQVLDKNVNEVIKDTNNLSKHPMVALPKSFKIVTVEADKAAKGVKKVSDEMKKVTKPTADAGYAMTNLGRIAQDLPFGFMAIQNNLSPLAESFAMLKKETGSTGAALKAMAASLTGPAGIMFAISAIPSIILIAQNGIMSFKKKTKEAADELEELKKSIGKWESSMRDARSEVYASAIQLEEWGQIALSSKKGTKEYTQAINEVAKISKSFADGLKDGSINASNFASNINLVTEALLAQKAVQAYGDEIIAIRKAIDQSQISIEKFNKEINRLGTDPLKQNGFEETEKLLRLFSVKSNLKNIQETNKEIADLEVNMKGMKDRLVEAIKEQAKYAQQLVGASKAEVQANDAVKARIDLLKKLNEEYKLSYDLQNDLFSLLQDQLNADLASGKIDQFTYTAQLRIAWNETFIEKDVKSASSKIDKTFSSMKFDGFGKMIEDGFGKNATANVNKGVKSLIASVERYSKGVRGNLGLLTSKEQMELDKKNLEELQEILANFSIIGNGLMDIYTDVFTTMISGSGNAFQAVISGLKRMVIQLISAAAAAATLSLILSGLGLGGGKSFSALFKGAFGGFTGLKLAAGATVSSPTMALIGENGSETVIPTRKLARLMQGNNNSSSNVNITGTLSARGSSFVASFDRIKKQSRRFT